MNLLNKLQTTAIIKKHTIMLILAIVVVCINCEISHATQQNNPSSGGSDTNDANTPHVVVSGNGIEVVKFTEYGNYGNVDDIILCSESSAGQSHFNTARSVSFQKSNHESVARVSVPSNGHMMDVEFAIFIRRTNGNVSNLSGTALSFQAYQQEFKSATGRPSDVPNSLSGYTYCITTKNFGSNSSTPSMDDIENVIVSF